ncbi:MAG TPA: alpha/beta fold hydrolase [Arenimonas sp.]|uniref:alpha/beta fold hydrolase n=1 Tax=Arenimonas sp. TaxID=1872635 RepID=UPI002D810609|nr:alpha/beta fold hydrolase [Arenimonas sp.]HEU0152314.1 alpha/beta fold hydrolase [Arenimonas sp.]
MSNPLLRRTAWLTLALAIAAAPAAGRDLAERIARPERGDTPFGGAKYLAFLDQVGSPLETLARSGEPTLAFAVIEPRDYRLDYRYRRSPDELGMRFAFRADAPRRAPPVRGTVLMLHGLTMDASTQGLWGLALAEDGYRTVLLDLRNHGFSGDGPAGFGTREAADVNALLAHLRAQHRLAEPVILFGTSYGAVTALHAAAADPAGIAGVVAMEPFANAGDSVRGYVQRLKAGDGGWSARAVGWWLRRTLPPAELDAAIARAGASLGLDLDALDTATPLAATQACVLLLHGARDRLVPVASARALARTGHDRLHYAELPDENHYSLPARIDWLRAPLRDWLARVARKDAADCPPLALPPDPLD